MEPFDQHDHNVLGMCEMKGRVGMLSTTPPSTISLLSLTYTFNVTYEKPDSLNKGHRHIDRQSPTEPPTPPTRHIVLRSSKNPIPANQVPSMSFRDVSLRER